MDTGNPSPRWRRAWSWPLTAGRHRRLLSAKHTSGPAVNLAYWTRTWQAELRTVPRFLTRSLSTEPPPSVGAGGFHARRNGAGGTIPVGLIAAPTHYRVMAGKICLVP